MNDDRPDPTVPPISWCRIFQVGPACGRLCEDCQETINSLTPAQRREVVADRVTRRS
jgi:hypothetical protein